MNNIKKTVLATSAALALIGGVVLSPLTAHGESGRPGAGQVTSSQQQTDGQQGGKDSTTTPGGQQPVRKDGSTTPGGQQPDGKDGSTTPGGQQPGGKDGSTGSETPQPGGKDGSTTGEQKGQPGGPTQSKQQPRQQGGDGITCTKGPKPKLVYGKDGFLTKESARQLVAAGCSSQDGSEFEEAANPERYAGPGGSAGTGTKGKAPVGKQGTTQPSTKLPRVAG